MQTRGGEVVLHRAPSRMRHGLWPPVDARWVAYDAIVRNLQLRADDCVFAVDLSDVGIIGNASELCERHPEAIMASSDTCAARAVKRWLRSYARRANYTTSKRLDDFFLRKVAARQPLFNCAITGGRMGALEPFRQQMVRELRRYHQSMRAERMHRASTEWLWVDMVVFNELLLRRINQTHANQSDQGVVSGYPVGPVNLPMWSLFCKKSPCGTDFQGKSIKMTSQCILQALREMAPRYYFSHKVKAFEPPR